MLGKKSRKTMGMMIAIGVTYLLSGGLALYQFWEDKKDKEKLEKENLELKQIAEESRQFSKANNRILVRAFDYENGTRGEFVIEITEYSTYDLDLGSSLVSYSADENGEWNLGLSGIPIKIKIQDRRLFIDCQLYNRNGELVFDMKDGAWNIDEDSFFSFNFDDTGLEIINAQNQIQLQFQIFENRISLLGMFFNPTNGGAVLITPDQIIYRNYNNPDFDELVYTNFSSIERNFKHHGPGYFRQRSTYYKTKVELLNSKRDQESYNADLYSSFSDQEILNKGYDILTELRKLEASYFDLIRGGKYDEANAQLENKVRPKYNDELRSEIVPYLHELKSRFDFRFQGSYSRLVNGDQLKSITRNFEAILEGYELKIANK
ncbi:hypothetical protein [Robiginitalea biformata]|uniref:hypothetical protein n=1 Tax=Robiginitalea biformata TaxID=252307 RepID=UPI003B5A4A6F